MIAHVSLQWERERNFGLWKVRKNLTHSSSPICLKFEGHLEHRFFPRCQDLSCFMKTVLGVRGGEVEGAWCSWQPLHSSPPHTLCSGCWNEPCSHPIRELCDSAAPAPPLAQVSHLGTEAAILRDQPKKVMPTYSGMKAAGERQRGFVSERSRILCCKMSSRVGIFVCCSSLKYLVSFPQFCPSLHA